MADQNTYDSRRNGNDESGQPIDNTGRLINPRKGSINPVSKADRKHTGTHIDASGTTGAPGMAGAAGELEGITGIRTKKEEESKQLRRIADATEMELDEFIVFAKLSVQKR